MAFSVYAPLTDPFISKVQAIALALGITPAVLGDRPLALHREPAVLVNVPGSPHGTTTYQLTPDTCRAWLALQDAARAQGVALALVSAFRSVDRQQEIIAAKLANGQSIAEILTSVAPPGYSEHHTGRAIDIGTCEDAALEEVFESTPSFAWLQVHAAAFGFVMSYPRDNAAGFVFEPWHWCYQGVENS
ncbi:MAG: D-alanyl-D-alanine carboxypeptidase [Burkholderiales bacterium PBB4]|nr:MAG: D-alanyl-D-alanine carboxypeptidase [Burkholderiales bacterium PBB4]